MQPPELFPGSQAGEVSWVSYPQVPIYHPQQRPAPHSARTLHPALPHSPGTPLSPESPFSPASRSSFKSWKSQRFPKSRAMSSVTFPEIGRESCHPSLLLTSKPRERARFISHAFLRHCPLSLHVEAEFYSVPSLRKSDMISTLEMLPSERAWHESLSVRAWDGPCEAPPARLRDPQGFSELSGWGARASDTRIHRKIGAEFQLKMIHFPQSLRFG